MSGRAAAVISLAVSVVLGSGHAVIAADPSPLAAEDARTRAEGLFSEGRTHYDLGEYAEAIRLFRESYALAREPLLVYNVAQAQRLLGQCRQALESYRQFVRLLEERDEAASSPEAATARKHIATLTGTCSARDPLVQPPSSVAEPRPVPPVSTSAIGSPARWSWQKKGATGLAAAAVVSFGVGVYFGIRAEGLAAENRSAPSYDPGADARGRSYAGWNRGLWVTSAVAVVAAGALLLFDR